MSKLFVHHSLLWLVEYIICCYVYIVFSPDDGANSEDADVDGEWTMTTICDYCPRNAPVALNCGSPPRCCCPSQSCFAIEDCTCFVFRPRAYC